MSPVISAGTRRSPRTKGHRPGPAARSELTWLNSSAGAHRRVRRLVAARTATPPNTPRRAYLRTGDAGRPFGIELARATLLVAVVTLAITLVLPALLALASN